VEETTGDDEPNKDVEERGREEMTIVQKYLKVTN
jgi:hypothetical protein